MYTLNLQDAKQVERSSFPDGQPHIKLLDPRALGESEVRVLTRITNPTDLFELGLLSDILQHSILHLSISYLMGARMDRRIDPLQPFTLSVVGDFLEATRYGDIEVFDPHSAVTITKLRAKAISPFAHVEKAVQSIKHNHGNLVLIAPDAGATKRVMEFGRLLGLPVVCCTKKRDSQTGHLSGFAIAEGGTPLDAKQALIVDDICDGGGTFVGLAKELRAVGAWQVHLYVSHGIFSKGIRLEGIDQIFTTDSYQDWAEPALAVGVGDLSEYYPDWFTVRRWHDTFPIW